MEAARLKKHMAVLYHRCLRILQDPDLAWDVVQETVTRYYEQLPTKEIQQPFSYLYSISTHHCVDLLRQRGRMLPMEPRMLQEMWGVESHRAEGALIVDKLVRRFGEELIQLVIYRHVDQMTYQEIADLVGKSDRGIKKKLDRIESQIRLYLQR